MAVHDALRVAGGAARVAHARGLVLVGDLGPLDRFGGGEQLLVVVDLDAAGTQTVGDLTLAVVHDHEMAQPFERRHQRGEQPEQ